MVDNGIPQSRIADIMFYTFDDLYEEEEAITEKSSNREEMIKYDLEFLHNDDQDEVIDPIFIV